ncbi:predicted protein [Naegleria gruberi]|uniref:Predicted protein n=1 Tax=Naegleria gruberi TaxID=5762 RepID=D2W2P8_NAEGR|nr:uncharacterized protein NAEGRDRAFT_75665 [Naegleria gruberi]EFC36656.1 predicted protein [Naegleria gruberi]|eukprot:XP_002669400.1 predicted protein [Naegleria gruberi strain NEG-M]
MKHKLSTARKSKRKFLENRMNIAFGYIPIEFYKDREYVLASIKKNGSHCLYDIHPEAFSDREILFEMLKSLKNDNFASVPIDNEILKPFANDREIVKLLIHLDSSFFDNQKFKFDREMALLACISCSDNCFGISTEFMEDEEFVLSAIEENYSVFNTTSDKLKNDKAFIRKALKRNGKVIYELSDELMGDEELIKIAIEQNPMVFEAIYENESINCGADVIKMAVEKNGQLLQFVTEDLENFDRIAVKQNPLALDYASDQLKNDRDSVLEAVKKDGSCFVYASEELRSNSSFVQEVIDNCAIPKESNEMHHVLLLILKEKGYCPTSVYEALRNIDKELALRIVSIHGEMICIMVDWQNDRDVLLTAFETCTSSTGRKRICSNIYITDKELIYEIFVKYSTDIIGQIYELDVELLRRLLQIDGSAFRLMDGKFKDEPILIEEAWKQSGYVDGPSDELYTKRMEYAYPEL